MSPRSPRLRRPTGPQGPVVLALESGGDHLGVALLKLSEAAGDPPGAWRLLGELTQHRGDRHGDAILGAAASLLASAGLSVADVGLVAVGRGPGGFTGVRVGMATALGLGLGLQIPVWPVESLRALAHNAAGAGGVAVPLIDARKGEVYGAAYSPNGDALMAPRVGPHDALLAAARAAVGDHAMRVFGSGAVLYECASAGVPGHWHVPAARHTATLAAAAWDAAGRPAQGPALDPAYVRASDAEIAHQQRAPAGTELPR